ncbi:MAG: AmmeMemoRadiSam system radical SAM enzyme [Planctomycetes bacterium]|nr:AmmeMemoRadiSam system radical SAM enzyme [Planctomycetota bacterium]
MATLKDLVLARTVEGQLYERVPGDKVRCFACGHRCLILDGLDGICRVRFNRGGTLRVPHGYAAGVQVDPIEKKPFFHAFPGQDALSFGMLGCDFHCAYCQNWVTSQALRDPEAVAPPREVTPRALVDLALEHGAPVVVSTYNEPLITAEWAVAVFREARAAGLCTGFVSNGNATPEALDYLRPHVDLYKVDLKGFDDRRYRKLGGTLANVLASIEGLVGRGFWVEVVTLVVPGFNDGEEELAGIARFLAGVSRDVPWHVTAFHPDYRMDDRPWTGTDALLKAWELGREAGLHFVYAGNRPGQVGSTEDTRCPGCGSLLIERVGYRVRRVRLASGACPDCGRAIPGVWKGNPPAADTGWRGPRAVELGTPRSGGGGRPGPGD